ncbi:hypothetical protein D3C72_717770 [compost metagenome]
MAGRTDHDLARGGELDRVGDQVQDDLAHLGLVGDDGAQGRVELDHQLEALVPGHRLGGRDDGLQELAGLDRLGVDRGLAGFHLGQVEDVVDQREQVARVAQHDAQVVLGLLRQLDALVEHHQLGVADDRVERRAQLVAHVGEELALHAVGGLGLVREGQQLLVLLLELLALGLNLFVLLLKLLALGLKLLVEDLELLFLSLHDLEVALELGVERVVLPPAEQPEKPDGEKERADAGGRRQRDLALLQFRALGLEAHLLEPQRLDRLAGGLEHGFTRAVGEGGGQIGRPTVPDPALLRGVNQPSVALLDRRANARGLRRVVGNRGRELVEGLLQHRLALGLRGAHVGPAGEQVAALAGSHPIEAQHDPVGQTPHLGAVGDPVAGLVHAPELPAQQPAEGDQGGDRHERVDQQNAANIQGGVGGIRHGVNLPVAGRTYQPVLE